MRQRENRWTEALKAFTPSTQWTGTLQRNTIPSDWLIAHGEGSTERAVQVEREANVLAEFYLSAAQTPPSPAEPDPRDAVANDDSTTKVIPYGFAQPAAAGTQPPEQASFVATPFKEPAFPRYQTQPAPQQLKPVQRYAQAAPRYAELARTPPPTAPSASLQPSIIAALSAVTGLSAERSLAPQMPAPAPAPAAPTAAPAVVASSGQSGLSPELIALLTKLSPQSLASVLTNPSSPESLRIVQSVLSSPQQQQPLHQQAAFGYGYAPPTPSFGGYAPPHNYSTPVCHLYQQGRCGNPNCTFSHQ